MSIFFKMLIASFLFILFWYFMFCYSAFYDCLSDDVDFLYGRKRMRHRRKKQKGFWRKFLFLDIRKEVILWHYVMFWMNLIFSAVTLIVLNVYIACGNGTVKVILIVLGVISLLTAGIMSFVRWPLYFGGNIFNKEKYRKEYRKQYRKMNSKK